MGLGAGALTVALMVLFAPLAAGSYSPPYTSATYNFSYTGGGTWSHSTNSPSASTGVWPTYSSSLTGSNNSIHSTLTAVYTLAFTSSTWNTSWSHLNPTVNLTGQIDIAVTGSNPIEYAGVWINESYNIWVTAPGISYWMVPNMFPITIFAKVLNSAGTYSTTTLPSAFAGTLNPNILSPQACAARGAACTVYIYVNIELQGYGGSAPATTSACADFLLTAASCSGNQAGNGAITLVDINLF